MTGPLTRKGDMTTTMITQRTADDCPDCATADRFCPAHLRDFVGAHATTIDQHRARMAAQAEWPRIEAAERTRKADADLDRTIRRVLANRPRNMQGLLALAVDIHDSRREAIAIDLEEAVRRDR